MRSTPACLLCALALTACVDLPARVFEAPRDPTADASAAGDAPPDDGRPDDVGMPDGESMGDAGLDGGDDDMGEASADAMTDAMTDAIAETMTDATPLPDAAAGLPCGADGVYFAGLPACLRVETPPGARLASVRAGHTMTRISVGDAFVLVGGDRDREPPPDETPAEVLPSDLPIAELIAVGGDGVVGGPLPGLVRERVGHAAVWVDAVAGGEQPGPAHLLVLGGRFGPGRPPRNAAVVWDLATARWVAPAQQLIEPHAHFSATTQPDGSVLLVGGLAQAEGMRALADAETYRAFQRDSIWQAVSKAPPDYQGDPEAMPRTWGHLSVALGGGAVMWGGGLFGAATPNARWTIYTGVEVLDARIPRPVANGPPVLDAAVVALGAPVTDVLVFGGTVDGVTQPFTYRYARATDAWTQFANGATARHHHTATPIGAAGWFVLIGGADDGPAGVTTVELIDAHDPAALQTFRGVAGRGPLSVPRVGHTAARLADGRVLVTGGRVDGASTADVFLLTWTALNTP